MIVLMLTSCPPSLRGDLTKWLNEIAAGVYVGRVSSRVRDKLWQRVVETSKGGRAVLVYSYNNEQGLDFKVHGETWEPIDFDGLKLMLRPSPARLKLQKEKRYANRPQKTGFSNASKYRTAQRIAKSKSKKENGLPVQKKNTYIVMDIETTGLKPHLHEIIEIAALKVVNEEITALYSSLVQIKKSVPSDITALSGIDDVLLKEKGKPLESVVTEIKKFIGNYPIVAHNALFDIAFLNTAFIMCGYGNLTNQLIDTLEISRRRLNLKSYKLKDLCNYFNLQFSPEKYKIELQGNQFHRSDWDCVMTHLLYIKLMKSSNLGSKNGLR